MTTYTEMGAPIHNAPIGVFDSGIGGLSVLRHIRVQLPHESILYFADAGFAPYGDKPEQVIIARSLAIAEFLMARGIKALAVPCNTATVAAIQVLRERYPDLPLVGVEPGLKPAIALTKTYTVGVLATKGTLASAKFQHLQAHLARTTGVRFLSQACIGLADQIEKGELHANVTAQLVQRYVAPLIEQGADTLVLGCTHYPFIQHLIEDTALRIATTPVTFVDTSEAVARQVARLLLEYRLQSVAQGTNALEAFTTGSAPLLHTAFSNLLSLHPTVTAIAVSSGPS